MTFDRPPVSEVVMGVGFSEVPGLTIHEFGRYWGTVSDRFPISELSPPIPPPGMPFSINSTPRLAMKNDDGTKLLQIQDNWLLFNWVRGASIYPRYGAVYEDFSRELEAFQVYLQGRGFRIPPLTQCRLSYVNHIPKSDGWGSPAEIAKIVPDFLGRWGNHRHLAELKAIVFHLAVETSAGQLDISIQNGRTRDNAEEILVLDLGVSSPVYPRALDTLRPWFDQARAVIVKSFYDLTSVTAHLTWGLHD